MPALHLSATTAGTPEIDHPRAERLIAGNPERQTLNLVDVPASGRLYCGIWRSEPGHWRIVMGAGRKRAFPPSSPAAAACMATTARCRRPGRSKRSTSRPASAARSR